MPGGIEAAAYNMRLDKIPIKFKQAKDMDCKL